MRETGILRRFSLYDPDIDPMTFIYERDPYSLEIKRTCENELFTSKLTKVTV